jgi:magnesium transporter
VLRRQAEDTAMLYATEMLGAETYDAQGNFVGRVKELFIEPGDQPNRISSVLLSRGRFRPLVARHDQLASMAPGTLRLNTDEGHLDLYQPNEAWLAVGKDLLDQQIIDTNGRKVVRVNDIDMNYARINGSTELRVTQVDVGLRGALSRLLKGVVPHSLIRQLQQKLPQRSIPWEFVNLIEADPLRRVKLRLTHDLLTKLHPADLADIIEELSPAERDSIFASLDETSAAEALAEVDDRVKAQIIEQLPPDRAADIMEEMPPDEAADVMADLSPETSERVLEAMQHKEAHDVRELLRFEDNTAGGMMNTECVVVGEDATREEVLGYLRTHEIHVDQLDSVVLIDIDAKFIGVVPAGRLILAEPDAKMRALKLNPPVSVAVNTKEKDIFELFDRYNLRSLVVVDPDHRPIGVIAVDDVVSRLCEKR